jgi:acetate kinase
MTVAEVEDLLYRRSGLLGVSGLASDMRALSTSEAPEAEEAIDLFAWRVARETGGLISSLEGLDGFVFTAGIGENHADVRARIGRRLAWAGVEIDPEANRRHGPVISTPGSRVTVRVIPTDEERIIARQAVSVIRNVVSPTASGRLPI